MKSRVLVLLAALVLVGTLPIQALQRAPAADTAGSPTGNSAPVSPTDESKVPHYFGPYANWANSPLTQPDATVAIEAAPPAPISAGNPLIDRAYATDWVAPPTTIDASATPLPTASYGVSVGSAIGGSFTLTVDGVATAAIAWDAIAADVVAALSAAGITASASGAGSSVDPWVIVFAAAPTSVTIDPAGLTQPPVPLVPVFVIVPTALPDGTLSALHTWNQATLGASPVPSAGQRFRGFVLRPGATPDEYLVVFDSGTLTVPALTTAGTSELATYPVSVPVQAGDVLAFYGAGIPVDIVASGLDRFSYPAPVSPAEGSTITFGVGDYPDYGQARTYSFGATVTPAGAGAGSGATASASVGANGAVTGLTITNPGGGYTTAPNVTISGSGTGATAEAIIQTSGAVTGVTVGQPGGGYTAPSVSISGGGATTDATAHALGGVDVVTFTDVGSGYTFPTVDFDLPDDPDGTQAQGVVDCVEAGCQPAAPGGTVTITGVTVTSPGSGYATAPGVVIRDGTQFDPVAHDPGVNPLSPAVATTTLAIQSVVLDTFGAGYTSAPSVVFGDTGVGSGASAVATTDVGAVVALNITAAGSGYVTAGGIRKFVDTLPGLTPAGVNNLGQYIPVAVPDTTTFPGTDYYVIAVVQHRERMHSDLPPTLLREYVQLSTSVIPGKQVALQTELLTGSSVPTLMPDGSQALAVDDPHFLGPLIVAQRDRAVRIVFYNLLPTGGDGDLFLPVDSTIMGSGTGPTAMADPVDQGSVVDGVRNPACSEYPKPAACFKDNRATLHLHGGVTPWISDGTPHQWITPANEATPWPRGVAVQNVPDMVGASAPAGVPDCGLDNSGCQTFYYTNQQSARLMFYHDHSWGITRLNVYAGEAAGYVITDAVEQKLFGPNGPYAAMGEGIPLIIQDRTFVPSDAQLALEDPTWDSSRWGTKGNFWYHHVYMPAQNPGDPSGMSAYGRWMYGPWFWPPATPQHGPIANPYYDPNCSLDDPATWQYQVDPFCEPAEIPGTPNISVGMEQFNDTPLVNGTAYPTVTLDPTSYRLRVLNAANDRFWNLQWYVADSTGTEVALKAAEVAAAQTDPNVFPTPDLALSPAGPDWIQFGTEGGFLPAPVVVDGQQVTTWITDPTRFDVGNVDKHSLLLAPAERADTIVDFSQFAGKTLILYNDAPAAFPARVPSYDYFTGGPDGLTLPGYGPNTRTIMQVKIEAAPPAPAFNLTAFANAFKHKADGSGVFEAGQHPIIVGQAAYNSAYGKTFAASGDCSNVNGTNKCDGFLRINQQGGTDFRFDTLRGPQLKIPIQPKAIHDEMNSAAFDEFGRMTANLGLEAVPATPALQNVLLYPYIAPPTEVIDATNLPKGDMNVTPISSASDGTQIWKITHNGVDTHPIHFHLYDVQVLNRVTWDNIIIPPDATELGWKDTVRISPLEDTIVALRPIIPTLPFEVPNSIRPLSAMMPLGADLDPNGLIVDPSGNVNTVLNVLVNFGWEYVYHCHILSHEEMDMMRPVLVALPPKPAGNLGWTVSGNGNNTRLTLTWTDNSITETSFVIQRQNGPTGNWVEIGTDLSPLDVANTAGGARSFTDTTFRWNSTLYSYRVVARNTVGYGGAYPVTNADAVSGVVTAIRAPSGLNAGLGGTVAAPQVNLTFTDNATNETGFVVERSTDGGTTFSQLTTLPARVSTGTVTYADLSVTLGSTYAYRVKAVVGSASSPYSNLASAIVSLPADPTNLSAAHGANQGSQRREVLNWNDNANNETSYTVVRATNSTFTSGVSTQTLAADSQTYTWSGLSRNTNYWFRVQANNGLGSSNWVTIGPILTLP